jgi:hypothetical protein
VNPWRFAGWLCSSTVNRKNQGKQKIRGNPVFIAGNPVFSGETARLVGVSLKCRKRMLAWYYARRLIFLDVSD